MTENLLNDALKTNLPRSNSHAARKAVVSTIKKCSKCLNENEIECICKQTNILIRPAYFEETCFIFSETENRFGVSSNELLSLRDLVTEVIYPFNKEYDFYRLNYNHRFNIYPIAVVRAHKKSDVVATINFCVKYRLPIRARGGAHAYQPASLVNFGIVLDQRPRDNATIDFVRNQVTIQTGALLGPVANKLSEHNFIIPTGTCVTNGVAGLTLGGGIGFYLREYGLTMDQLVSAKIVLANGSLINTNSKSNSDLFWALKGAGGGNFGVVTDLTFNLTKIGYVTIFTLYYNFIDAKAVLKTWQSFAPNTITKLTSEFDIFNKYQPVIVTGQLLPVKNPKSDLKLLIKLIKPLLDLNLQTNLSIKTMSVKESYEYFGQGSYARPLFFYNKSDFNFDLLSDEAIDTIIYYMSLLNKSQTHHKTEIDALGGNFSSIASEATAFPSRKAIHWLQYTSLWDTSDEQDPNIEWLQSYYNAMRPYFPLNRKYVNALDYDSTRESALNSYYADNLDNLITIKQKYDPTDVFRFEQSIPVSQYPINQKN